MRKLNGELAPEKVGRWEYEFLPKLFYITEFYTQEYIATQ